MPTLALNFLKARPGMGSVLVGARNVRQLRQNLDAYEAQVPADVLARLEELSAGLRDQMGTTQICGKTPPTGTVRRGGCTDSLAKSGTLNGKPGGNAGFSTNRCVQMSSTKLGKTRKVFSVSREALTAAFQEGLE